MKQGGPVFTGPPCFISPGVYLPTRAFIQPVEL